MQARIRSRETQELNPEVEAEGQSASARSMGLGLIHELEKPPIERLEGASYSSQRETSRKPLENPPLVLESAAAGTNLVPDPENAKVLDSGAKDVALNAEADEGQTAIARNSLETDTEVSQPVSQDHASRTVILSEPMGHAGVDSRSSTD